MSHDKVKKACGICNADARYSIFYKFNHIILEDRPAELYLITCETCTKRKDLRYVVKSAGVLYDLKENKFVESEDFLRPPTLLGPDPDLLGSIKKWEDILFYGGKDHAATNCPLCDKYAKVYNCSGCVIAEATGTYGCRKTPYTDWVYHHKTDHGEYNSKGGVYIHPGCTTCIRLAGEELDFLRSLLPNGPKGVK